MVRMHEYYETVVKPGLMEESGVKNPMRVPKIEKIVINMGVGEGSQDRKKVDAAVQDMTKSAGQQPVITKAKKSSAAFKLRDGMTIGCKVTLRRDRMYEFLDRLITVALPRVRDFRGISSKSFDGAGNFALGLKEQIVFPEIDYDKVDQVRGMNVVICTTAKTDDEARALLKGFDMPFSGRDREKEQEEEAAKRAEQEALQQAAREALKEEEGEEEAASEEAADNAEQSEPDGDTSNG